ncbi:MAG: hypothetical protein OEM41_00405 [Ignavibacteria bacterium]|nr:hypothetical protein [Ignavibacteria bacterium]
MKTFPLAFVPLFVAMNVFGGLPTFVGFTETIDEPRRRRLTAEATLTAVGVSLLFLTSGKPPILLSRYSGNRLPRWWRGDPACARCVRSSVLEGTQERIDRCGADRHPSHYGSAALPTLIIIENTHGYVWAIASLIVNLGVVWIACIQARRISRLMAGKFPSP